MNPDRGMIPALFSRIHWLWLGIGLCLGWSLNSEPVWAASDSECKQLYRRKKIQEAAQCFEEYLRQFLSKPKLNSEERYQVGLALRNTNLMYRKAAKQEKQAIKAAYLREKALRYISLYLAGKYYATKSQRRYAVVIRERLKQAIGYAQVTILGGHPKARVRLIGYQYKGSGQGTFSLSLRPGTYTILAKYPDGSTQAKSAVAKPNTPLLVQFKKSVAVAPKKPNIRKKPPQRTSTSKVAQKKKQKDGGLVRKLQPMPRNVQQRTVVTWTLVGSGAALLIVGAVMVGLAIDTNGKADQTETDLRQKLSVGEGGAGDTKSLAEQQALANGLLQGGVAVGVVGLAAGVTGLILGLQKPSSSPSPPKRRKGIARRPIHPNLPGATSNVTLFASNP